MAVLAGSACRVPPARSQPASLGVSTLAVAWKQVAVGQMGSALYEIVPGFVAATVAIVVVSLLGRAPGAAIATRHAQVRETLAEQGY